VHVEASERVQLVVNELEGNGVHGVFLHEAHRGRLFENAASGNETAGFFLEHGHHNVFLRNEARANLVGFALSGAVEGDTRFRFTTSHNGVHDNVAADNERWGFLLGDVGHTVLARNRASGSLFGVAVIGRSRGNRVSGTGASVNGVGILVDGAADTWVVGNVLGKNDEDGIRVSATAVATRLEDNDASVNGDDGIDVASPATTLRRNLANDNGDLGIEAVAGVADRGGNSAAGNGDPAQCVNVACD
jgi:parallel beta-helix repeat protein